MKPVLNPDPSISSIPAAKPRNSPLLNLRTCLRFPAKHGDRWIERNRLVSKAVLNSTTADELGISEPEFLNPTVSSSYRDPKLRRPNQTVLDAQARVCTGPTQTRPLSEEQAFKVLDTIVRSAKGECRGEEQEVSKAQLGAFFAAMTIRANSFPEATQWE